MPGRAQGTSCDRFDPGELEHLLEPHAKLKQPSCDFGFEDYGKKRSQGPDREGLLKYAVLLELILSLCPRGLPMKSLVMITLSELDRKHNVRTELTKQQKEQDWLDKTSDRICTAARHVRDLAKSRTTYLHPKLKELTAMIKDQETQVDPRISVARERSPKSSPNRAKPRKELSKKASDASSSCVQICNVLCRCEECRKKEKPIDVDADDKVDPFRAENDEADTRSETSRQALGLTEHVPASRGGQKRKAEEIAEDKKEEAAEKKGAKKTAMRVAMKAATAMKAVKAAKAMKAVNAAKTMKAMKAPRRAKPIDVAASAKFSIVRRRNPYKEAYILKDGLHMVACKERQSDDYETLIETLCEELKEGKCTATKEEAKKRLLELLQ